MYIAFLLLLMHLTRYHRNNPASGLDYNLWVRSACYLDFDFHAMLI